MSDTQPNEGAPAPAHTYAPPAESASAPPGAPEEWIRRPVGDFDPRYKSPRSAVFLSMIFPGLGQIYTGFYTRGLMIWGFAVLADSPQFSALVAAHSERDKVGTSLTLVNCIGFALTIPSIELTTRLAALWEPRCVLLLLLPGPILGVWASRSLAR